MTAHIIPLHATTPPGRTSRQLADTLLIWHAAFHEEIGRNDRSAEDCERAGAAQLASAQRCTEEATASLPWDRETYLGLMACAARYVLSARIYFARAQELRS